MVRTALDADVPRLAQLHISAWRAAYRGQIPDDHLDSLDASKRAAMWAAALRDWRTVVQVAVDRSSIVGFCSLMPSRDEDATPITGEITALYIDSSYWRSGYGTALLTNTAEVAWNRGFERLTLWVLATNAPARAFYEARGFSADGWNKVDESLGFPLVEVRYRSALPVRTFEAAEGHQDPC